MRTQGAFNITFYNSGETDGGGYTGSQNWTAQQMDDVAASAATWTSRIGNIPSRQVDMHVFWNSFSGNTLGGSSSPLVGDYATAWSLPEYVWRAGGDFTRPAGYYADTTIVYDADAAGFGWNFGTGKPGALQVDFRSVITHEIGHSLGFGGAYDSATDTWWFGGVTAWDANLRDSAGNQPAPDSTGTPGDFNQLDNPVYFVGANAVAANGGNPVPIYAPPTFSDGSSLSHLDEATYPNSLMSPFIGLGETVREPSSIEWAMMSDMGWNIVPIPEPSTIVALLGLAGAGFVGYRWRRRPALPAENGDEFQFDD